MRFPIFRIFPVAQMDKESRHSVLFVRVKRFDLLQKSG